MSQRKTTRNEADVNAFLDAVENARRRADARLGKFRTGRSCLYVNKLDDVDLGLLEQLVRESAEEMKRRYG